MMLPIEEIGPPTLVRACQCAIAGGHQTTLRLDGVRETRKHNARGLILHTKVHDDDEFAPIHTPHPPTFSPL